MPFLEVATLLVFPVGGLCLAGWALYLARHH